MKLLFINGSFRKASYNLACLKYIEKHIKSKFEIKYLDYQHLPIYHDDLHRDSSQFIQDIIETVQSVDGIVIATPEYNFSIPGSLKNLLDWLSIPLKDKSKLLYGKKITVLSSTVGSNQALMAQEHLRQILTFMGADVLSQPRITIAHIWQQIDDKGQLVPNEPTQMFLTNYIEALIQFFNR